MEVRVWGVEDNATQWQGAQWLRWKSWRRELRPELTGLSQTTELFTATAVRMSNLTLVCIWFVFLFKVEAMVTFGYFNCSSAKHPYNLNHEARHKLCKSGPTSFPPNFLLNRKAPSHCIAPCFTSPFLLPLWDLQIRLHPPPALFILKVVSTVHVGMLELQRMMQPNTKSWNCTSAIRCLKNSTVLKGTEL